jgi:hypothetical protein
MAIQIPLTNTITVLVKRIPNIELLHTEDDFPIPKPPSFYIEEQDRWVDNPDHPDYHSAMQLRQVSQAYAVYDTIIEKAVTFSGDYLSLLTRQELKLYVAEQEQYKFIVSKYGLDTKIIELAILTENAVQAVLNRMAITRNGTNIFDVPITNALNTSIVVAPLLVGETGIQAVHPMDEFACVKSANGISWEKWINGEYSLPYMATTIALYRASQVIELHINDAQQIESERKSKKNNKG